MPRLHKKSIARRGLTAMRVMHLLTGRDYWGGYGRDEPNRGTQFDEEAARHDWAAARVLLLPEFRQLNPNKVCWAEATFDDAKVPADQTSFSGFDVKPIVHKFPF